MKTFRRLFFFFLFLVLPLLPARAQASGEWFTAGISFNLPKKFSAKVSTGERFLNTGIGLVKYLFQFEGGYKINKHFLFKLDYIDYDYDYSGSGWHLGAPKPLDSTPVLGFPTYSSARKYMLGLTARF